MKQVNLLHQSLNTKNELLSPLIFSVAVTLLSMVIVSLVIRNSLIVEKNVFLSQIKVFEHQLKNFSPQLRDMKILQQEKQSLQQSVQIWRFLQKKRIKIERFLGELSKSALKQVYFTEVKMAKNVVSIAGVALQQQDVTVLLAKIERMKYFKQPKVVEIGARFMGDTEKSVPSTFVVNVKL